MKKYVETDLTRKIIIDEKAMPSDESSEGCNPTQKNQNKKLDNKTLNSAKK